MEQKTVTKEVKQKKIKFLEGRPERDLPIGAEDIINLKIALETAKTLEEFLAKV